MKKKKMMLLESNRNQNSCIGVIRNIRERVQMEETK
jgi:hypothetical protein